jgi:hypothetical protein
MASQVSEEIEFHTTDVSENGLQETPIAGKGGKQGSSRSGNQQHLVWGGCACTERKTDAMDRK